MLVMSPRLKWSSFRLWRPELSRISGLALDEPKHLNSSSWKSNFSPL